MVPCDMFRPTDREETSNTAYGWDYMTGTWVFRPDFPTRIFDWFAAWGPQHYDIVGVVDILSTSPVYLWDGQAAAYKPQSPRFLRILGFGEQWNRNYT
jgi:hypothetical protein